MSEVYAVTAAAGSLRTDDAPLRLPHRWTDGGVSVQADFTGAHLLHLAVAGCVLNDLYREAEQLGITLDGVRVSARGAFDDAGTSTGVVYAVEVDSSARTEDLARLVQRVDEVAEIPRAVRAGASVRRGA